MILIFTPSLTLSSTSTFSCLFNQLCHVTHTGLAFVFKYNNHSNNYNCNSNNNYLMNFLNTVFILINLQQYEYKLCKENYAMRHGIMILIHCQYLGSDYLLVLKFEDIVASSNASNKYIFKR